MHGIDWPSVANPAALALLAGAVVIVFLSMSSVLSWSSQKSQKASPPPEVAGQFIRVGGRTIDSRDWSPVAIDGIRKGYFRPTLAGMRVVVLDLTATCARGHATSERVVLVARNSTLATELHSGILRSRADINCTDCGKRAHLSAKAVIWEGPSEEWDGSV